MATQPIPPANLGGKVLIADDDPAIADALRFMLEDEGYGVVSAFAGDIVADVRRERPDVVLLDVRLAGQDGRELCRAIKRQEVTALTPVILVSADPDCAAIATEAGADDFLAKPFEMDDLLAKVARFAKGWRDR